MCQLIVHNKDQKNECAIVMELPVKFSIFIEHRISVNSTWGQKLAQIMKNA